jgi:hypothetical protein
MLDECLHVPKLVRSRKRHVQFGPKLGEHGRKRWRIRPKERIGVKLMANVTRQPVGPGIGNPQKHKKQDGQFERGAEPPTLRVQVAPC